MEVLPWNRFYFFFFFSHSARKSINGFYSRHNTLSLLFPFNYAFQPLYTAIGEGFNKKRQIAISYKPKVGVFIVPPPCQKPRVQIPSPTLQTTKRKRVNPCHPPSVQAWLTQKKKVRALFFFPGGTWTTKLLILALFGCKSKTWLCALNFFFFCPICGRTDERTDVFVFVFMCVCWTLHLPTRRTVQAGFN